MISITTRICRCWPCRKRRGRHCGHPDARQVFITGHCEYDRYTLAGEYDRDCKRGISPRIPQNYFPGDNPRAVPPMLWRGHANLLFSNWLNYFVYQQTPYDLTRLD